MAENPIECCEAILEEETCGASAFVVTQHHYLSGTKKENLETRQLCDEITVSNTCEEDYPGLETDVPQSREETEKLDLQENQDVEQCWIEKESNDDDFVNEDTVECETEGVTKPHQRTPALLFERLLPCDFCSHKFMTPKTLRKHVRLVHNTERSFCCDECGRTFTSSGHLRAHLRKAHFIETGLDCTDCDESFQRADDLKTHMREKHKNMFCTPCGKIFSGIEFYKKHVNVFHNNEELRKCRVCGKSYTGLDTYLKHVKQHKTYSDLFFKCHICDKVFNFEKNFELHKNTHTESDSYNCNLCERSFDNQSALNSHRQSDHNEGLACDLCGKTFRRSAALKHHRITHDEPYQCDVCDKAFKTIRLLKSHRTCHSSDSFRSCEQCDNMFPTLVALNGHISNFHNSDQEIENT